MAYLSSAHCACFCTGRAFSSQVKEIAIQGLEQSVALSRKIETGSSEIQAKLEDIPRLSRAVQNSAAIMQASVVASESERMEIQAHLGGISGLGRMIKDNSALTRSAMVRLDAYETETLAMARQTSIDLRGLADEWRNLGPSVCGILSPTQRGGRTLTFPHHSLHDSTPFYPPIPRFQKPCPAQSPVTDKSQQSSVSRASAEFAIR